MKNIKIILIFSALLSVFVLNSCKDDESTDNSSLNSDYSSGITIANLKSYVGQTAEQIASKIKSKEFYFVSKIYDKGYYFYTYNRSNDKSYIKLREYNGIISKAEGYKKGDKTELLNLFVQYSSEGVSFAASNLAGYTYKGFISYKTTSTSYTQFKDYKTHSEFLSGYYQYKNNIEFSDEMWISNGKNLEIYFDKDKTVSGATYSDNTYNK